MFACTWKCAWRSRCTHTMRMRTCVPVVVCVVHKPRPCPSCSGRRDCNNSVHWRSLYKGGGSCGVPLRDTPYPCEGHKMEAVHYPGPTVQVRFVDATLVGGCCTHIGPEHTTRGRLGMHQQIDHCVLRETPVLMCITQSRRQKSVGASALQIQKAKSQDKDTTTYGRTDRRPHDLHSSPIWGTEKEGVI